MLLDLPIFVWLSCHGDVAAAVVPLIKHFVFKQDSLTVKMTDNSYCDFDYLPQ